MSDRIAVMLNGRLQQIATADELYNRPVNIDVAGFIGSPQINLLPSRIDADRKIRLAKLALDLDCDLAVGAPVTVGIRPEALQLGDSQNAGAIKGMVRAKENLGADLFVHVQVEGMETPLVVRLAADQNASIALGDMVGVIPSAHKAHVFDERGQRLTTSCGDSRPTLLREGARA